MLILLLLRWSVGAALLPKVLCRFQLKSYITSRRIRLQPSKTPGGGSPLDQNSVDDPEIKSTANAVSIPDDSVVAASAATDQASTEAISGRASDPYTTDRYVEADKAFGITSVIIPATVEVIDPAFFQQFPHATAVTVASENAYFKSYNGMLFNRELSSLLLVPEGMEGTAVLPDELATVPACVFSRCTKLSALQMGSMASAHFTTENGILYKRNQNDSGEPDGTLTLVAAPAGIGASVHIAPACATIAEGAFWGNRDLLTIVSTGEIMQIDMDSAEAEPEDGVDSSKGDDAVVAAFNDDTLTNATVVTANRSTWEDAGFTSFADLARPGDTVVAPSADSGLVFSLLDDYTLSVAWRGDDPVAGKCDIPSSVDLHGVSYAVSTIAEEAFAGQTELTEVVIPDTVTSIGPRAFAGCTGLADASIPGNVTNIGEAAFEGCGTLKGLDLHEGTRAIGAHAFAETGLEQMILPTTMASIGAGAFADCGDLTSIVALAAVSDVAPTALNGCTGVSIYVPAGDTAWTTGVPAAGNRLCIYGVQPARDAFSLDAGQSVNIFVDGGQLLAPEPIEVRTSYRAAALSVDTTGTVTAKQPGSVPVNITLHLDERILAKATTNIVVNRPVSATPPVAAGDHSDAEDGSGDEDGTESADDGESDATEEGASGSDEVKNVIDEGGDGFAGEEGTADDQADIADEDVDLEDVGEAIDEASGLEGAEALEGEDFTTPDGVPMISRATALSASVAPADARATSDPYVYYYVPSGKKIVMRIFLQTGNGSGVGNTYERTNNPYKPDVFTNQVGQWGSRIDQIGEHNGSRGDVVYRIGLVNSNTNVTTSTSIAGVSSAWMVRFNNATASVAAVLATTAMVKGSSSNTAYLYVQPYLHQRVNIYLNGANNSTVTWNANGGTCGTGSSTARPYEIITAPTPNARTGYTFAGWYTEATGGTKVCDGGGSTPRITSSRTYYARWTPNTYTVSFNANGGTGAPSSLTATYGATPPALTGGLPTRAGYRFVGWFDGASNGNYWISNSHQWQSVSGGIDAGKWVRTANLTLYAHWESGYSLTLISSGHPNSISLYGSGTVSGSIGVPIGDSITLNSAYMFSMGETDMRIPGAVHPQYGQARPEWTVEPSNKDFLGWVEPGSSDVLSNMMMMLTSNTTLYAVWRTAAVTLNPNFPSDAGNRSTNHTTSVSATYGQAMPSITVPSATGYTFIGYQLPSGQNQILYYYSNGTSARARDFTGDATLIGAWVRNTNTVSFNANGGSGGQAANVTASWGLAMPSISKTAPTRTGYTFGGWYDTNAASGGTQYYTAAGASARNWDKTSNTTLYARWTPNRYDVSFNANGGSGGQTAKVQATYGSAMPTISTTAPTRTGYTFGGWYDTSGSSGGTQYYTAAGASARNWDKTSNTTLYARWTPNRYDVSFNANGGSGGQTAKVQATYGSAMPTISTTAPTRTGYTFGGWYDTSGSSGGTQYYTAAGASARNWDKTSNTTLYARWTGNSYTVSFNVNGGSGGQSASVKATYGSAMPTISTAKPIRAGYTFGGWYDSSAETGGTQYYTAACASARAWDKANDATLYARWIPNQYNVSFNANGGSGGQTATVKATYSKDMPTISTTAPARTGYTFGGWYDTNAASGGTQYYTAAGASARTYNKITDTTLYARWTPNRYQVSFNANGGTGGPSPVQATYDADMPTPLVNGVPARAGYTFAGWYDTSAASGGTQYYTAALASAHKWDKANAATLYARWSVNTYTISYNLAGGSMPSGKTNPTSYTIETATFTLNNPERAGYTFAGWTVSGASSITGGGVSANGTTTTVNRGTYGNLAFTARWTANTYNIAYNLGGGSVPSGKANPASYTIETATFTLNNPERRGYTFAGWTVSGASNIAGGGVVISGTTATVNRGTYGHLTFAAKWTANVYKITLTNKDATGKPGTETIYVRYDDAWYTDQGCTNKTTSLPVLPERIGWTFKGYPDVVDEHGRIIAATNKFAEDVTRDPSWEANIYRVNYHQNVGDTGDTVFEFPEPPYFDIRYEIETKSIWAKTPVRTGYEFQGWSLSPEGDVLYHENDRHTHLTAGDIDLYAQWKQKGTDGLTGYALKFYQLTTEEGGPLEFNNGAYSGRLPYERKSAMPAADWLLDEDKISGWDLYGWSFSNKMGETDGAKETVIPSTCSVRDIVEAMKAHGLLALDADPDEIHLYAVWQPRLSMDIPTHEGATRIVVDMSDRTTWRAGTASFYSQMPAEIDLSVRSQLNEETFNKVFPGTGKRLLYFDYRFKSGDSSLTLDESESDDTWSSRDFDLDNQNFTKVGRIGKATDAGPARLAGRLYLDSDYWDGVNFSKELDVDPETGLVMNTKFWDEPLARLTWGLELDKESGYTYTMFDAVPSRRSD